MLIMMRPTLWRLKVLLLRHTVARHIGAFAG